MLGSSKKRPTPSEVMNKKVVQRFLVAARDIKSGEILRKKMVTAKRTSEGGGLGVALAALILGKKAKRLITADKLIKKAYLI